MQQWGPNEWGTLITAAVGAVASAIVTVLAAWRSHLGREEIKARLDSVAQKQDIHEQNAERRAQGGG
jgi:hypothetical protein